MKSRGAASAETLAWATLDAIQSRLSPQEAVVQCGQILRLFSKNDEFRGRAVELYEKAFEHPHLDQLIEISGLREASQTGAQVFHAGTRLLNGTIATAGGRVLGVTAGGSDLAATLENTYQAVDKIRFEGMHYRRDIGSKGLKHGW